MYTSCKVEGPEHDIERFKAEDLNGIDFDGDELSLITPGDPPIAVFEKIVSMFPSLSFVNMTCQYRLESRFYKGEITAAGVNLVKDDEALAQFEADMARSVWRRVLRERIEKHTDNLMLIAMKTIGEDGHADDVIARLVGMSEAEAAEAAVSIRAAARLAD
jgi:hypothetical protein